MTDGKENMEKKQDRKIFAAYMAGFLILAATLALMQPLADTPPLYPNAPDEHARFLVPWYICQHGVIPTGFEEEVRIPAYGFSYILYNAFPYIVQGYIMRFVSIFTSSQQILLYVGRFVNVLSGACMAWVVWLLGKRLFKERKWGMVFSFLVTYLPESLFMHTYINTDSMCMLATAMIVYGLVSAWQDDFYIKNSMCLAAGGLGCILLNGKIYELAVGRKNISRLWVGADLKKERTMGQWCFFHANMIFCILMPTALLIYYAYTMDYQNQGRYLLPAIVPLMYYLVRGFEKLAQIKYWPKWLARLIPVLAAAFVVLSAVYMVYIVSVPVYLGYHPLL